MSNLCLKNKKNNTVITNLKNLHYLVDCMFSNIGSKTQWKSDLWCYLLFTSNLEQTRKCNLWSNLSTPMNLIDQSQKGSATVAVWLNKSTASGCNPLLLKMTGKRKRGHHQGQGHTRYDRRWQRRTLVTLYVKILTGSQCAPLFTCAPKLVGRSEKFFLVETHTYFAIWRCDQCFDKHII